jgi:ABC-type sugar transport system permease subunit
MYLYSTAFERGDLGYSAAIGWLLVLLLAAVSAAQLKISGTLEEER